MVNVPFPRGSVALGTFPLIAFLRGIARARPSNHHSLARQHGDAAPLLANSADHGEQYSAIISSDLRMVTGATGRPISLALFFYRFH
jgi:hypothetical protein